MGRGYGVKTGRSKGRAEGKALAAPAWGMLSRNVLGKLAHISACHGTLKPGLSFHLVTHDPAQWQLLCSISHSQSGGALF